MSDTPKSPFKGLEPYSMADKDVFFGRDDERDIVVANLEANRLTLVYGESGVGKTSLLQAGVIPELDRRVADDPLWSSVVYVDSWTGDVTRTVADRFVGRSSSPDPTERPDLRAIARDIGAQGGSVLAVLDQFEEYFLYQGHHGEKSDFESQFAGVVNDLECPVHFLVSIREDAVAKLDRFEDRIPRLFSHYLRIEPLRVEEGRYAVRRACDTDGRATPESDLIDAVLDAVRVGAPVMGDEGVGSATRDPADAIEAAYLQLVMQRLWDEDVDQGKLRLSTFKRLGGLPGILREHLERAMAELSDKQRDLADRMFLQLVTPSGAKIAHTAKDLAGYAKRSPAEAEEVLKQLTSHARLLRAEKNPTRPEEVLYEIRHDKLAPAVLDWRRRRELRAAQRRQEKLSKWIPAFVAAVVFAVIVVIGSLVYLYGTDTGHEVRKFYSVFLVAAAFAATVVGLVVYLRAARERRSDQRRAE